MLSLLIRGYNLYVGSHSTDPSEAAITTMTYWPAGGGGGQNPENTAQGHSGHTSICR